MTLRQVDLSTKTTTGRHAETEALDIYLSKQKYCNSSSIKQVIKSSDYFNTDMISVTQLILLDQCKYAQQTDSWWSGLVEGQLHLDQSHTDTSTY